jgi:hypothetical protein
MRVIKFAAVIGILDVKIPNNNHSKVPNVNNPYMYKEMPEVSFVFIVCKAWGKNEAVVHKAATKPRIVLSCILQFQFL